MAEHHAEYGEGTKTINIGAIFRDLTGAHSRVDVGGGPYCSRVPSSSEATAREREDAPEVRPSRSTARPGDTVTVVKDGLAPLALTTLDGTLDPPAARAPGALTGDQNSIIDNAPIDAAVMQALASANGRFHLELEAETFTPELAAALPRTPSSSQTVLDVPDMTLAAAEALTIACAERGGCGPLDLITSTASAAALEHLVEHWGELLLLPDHSSTARPCPAAPPMSTRTAANSRAMERWRTTTMKRTTRRSAWCAPTPRHLETATGEATPAGDLAPTQSPGPRPAGSESGRAPQNRD